MPEILSDEVLAEGKRLVEALGEWERQERIVFALAEAMIARIEELDALKGRTCRNCASLDERPCAEDEALCEILELASQYQVPGEWRPDFQSHFYCRFWRESGREAK